MAGQLLSPRQLDRMRRVANRLLPDTAAILRRTLADDGEGGKESSYAQVGTAACRLSAVNVATRARDRATGGRIEPAEGWIVSLPVGTDVRETDRLTIKGVTYEVISSADSRSYEVNLRLVVKRV
jgi:hypothetical protein